MPNQLAKKAVKQRSIQTRGQKDAAIAARLHRSRKQRILFNAQNSQPQTRQRKPLPGIQIQNAHASEVVNVEIPAHLQTETDEIKEEKKQRMIQLKKDDKENEIMIAQFRLEQEAKLKESREKFETLAQTQRWRPETRKTRKVKQEAVEKEIKTYYADLITAIRRPKGKRVSILENPDIDITVGHGGVYCFMPFDKLDADNKSVFKVGMATNFNNRVKAYSTFFPQGVYMVAFLVEPPLKVDRGATADLLKSQRSQFFKRVEAFIFKKLMRMPDSKAKVIYSYARDQNKDSANASDAEKGRSEWVYTTQEVIHKVFRQAYNRYYVVNKDTGKRIKGTLKLFTLGEPSDAQTNVWETLNEITKAKEKNQFRKLFKGEILIEV